MKVNSPQYETCALKLDIASQDRTHSLRDCVDFVEVGLPHPRVAQEALCSSVVEGFISLMLEFVLFDCGPVDT